MNISDIVMEVLAMESSLLRRRKLAGDRGANAADACTVYLRDALTRIELASRTVISACAEGQEMSQRLAALRTYACYDPVNTIALRRQIAARLLATECYTI